MKNHPLYTGQPVVTASSGRHSGFGIASFVTAILAFAVIVVLMAASLGTMASGSSGSMAAGLALLILATCGAPLVGVVGIALGIMGVRDRGTKRGFSVAGLTLNALFVAAMFGLFTAGALRTAVTTSDVVDAAVEQARTDTASTREARAPTVSSGNHDQVTTPEDLLEASDSEDGPAIGTRSNPVPPGHRVTFVTGQEQRVALTLVEYAWGERAHEIRNTDEDYATYGAHDDHVLVLVLMKAEYLDGAGDVTWRVHYSDDFQAEAQNVVQSIFIDRWEAALRGSMYPGGEVSGWIAFQVPEGTEPHQVKLRYEPRFSFLDNPEIWFALE